ncbi:MAG: PIN domain nuclease [Desulfopila sp.]|jgi:predicted nucleic acid-binding protein|nr:PIN domain nuclease [Desulfopila sp.]
MILVDSSVWIAYFTGNDIWQSDALEKILPSQPLLIGDLILTEVLQGFRSEKDYKKAKSFLGFLNFKELVGYEIAVKSSSNYRLLRKNGITVRKTIDVIIGTFCIENHIRLLHNDHDFDPMEKLLGLNVISPEIML